MDSLQVGNRPLTPDVKGMSLTSTATGAADVSTLRLNVLDEDVNFPVAVLRMSALEQNIRWMSEYVSRSDALFAPHGKTSMCPELFTMQLDAGAWGVTLATSHQVAAARKSGINRILMASQLVGKQSIAYVISELKRDPDFDFYCLVDNADNAMELDRAVRDSCLDRPLQVMIEIGFDAGRTGVRTQDDARALARTIADSAHLALRGIEGFEGLISATEGKTRQQKILTFLTRIVGLVKWCDEQALFAPGDILLSAGGSSFYDLVLDLFKDVRLSSPHKVVTRSGCYLTHDAILYKKAFEEIQARSSSAREVPGGLVPALEVWGYVISRPEPCKLIVNVGKRDVGHDDLPLMQTWCRPQSANAAQRVTEPLSSDHVVTQLDDQHCHVTVPADSPLKVGDMVQFGISHPCLTFDKWRNLFLVDDGYNVTKAVDTYF